MNVTFGFLSNSDTYRADLPDGLSATAEYTVPYVAGGVMSELGWVSAETFATFPLKRRTVATTQSGTVEIYEYQSDPAMLALAWRVGEGVLWTQVAPDARGNEPPELQGIIERVHVRRDRRGIPRAQFGLGAIGARVSQRPAEREQATFVAANGAAPVWSVRFRNDGARAADSTATLEGASTATASTSFGISVVCDGPAEASDAVQSTARAIAASVEAI